jgi:xylulokinase
MHGAVLVDGAGTALRPALLWPDHRAGAELDRWRALPMADRAALANPLVPGMTGPMVAWLARHEPELVARAATVLMPKDALRATLLPGSPPAVTDRSDASATLLWDVTTDGWSAAAVGAAGVDPGLLPQVRPSAEVVGTASLPVGEVPVVVGGADTPLALLAAGMPAAQVNLGTGAQLLRPGWGARAVDDPQVHGYADVAGGWYAMAALQNGGSAWAWVCGVLGMSWADLFDAAAAAPAGAGGVVFRPFLTGERGGVAGAADRGGWAGLQAGTTRSDLARAAVEGVAFAIGAAFGLLDEPDRGEPVVLTGGGVRSAVVQQVLASVLRRPVRYLGVRSASAVGAAALAGRGVGLDVVPRRTAGPVVHPRSDGELAAAAERWAGTAPAPGPLG